MKTIILILLINLSLFAQKGMPHTPIKNIVFDGNSLFNRTGSSTINGYRVESTFMSLIAGTKLVYNSYAIGGRTTPVLYSEFTTKVVPWVNSGDILVLWEITNDAHHRVGDTNGDTLYSDLSDYCTLAKSYGLTVYVLTGIPRFISGLDDAGITSRINNCNTKLRNNHSFCDGVIDIAATPIFSATTSYTNTIYYDVDQCHLTNRGYDSVAYKLYRELPHN